MSAKPVADSALADARRTLASGGRRRGARSFWSAAIGVALVVHGAAFVLLDVPTGRTPAPLPAIHGVGWLGDRPETADPVISEQLALKDPVPLYLPTQRNYSRDQQSVKDDRRPGDIFPLDPPTFTVPSAQSLPRLIELPEGVSTVRAAMRDFTWPFFAAYGRVDHPVSKVSPRLGFIEITSVPSSEVVLMEPVPESAALGASSAVLWRPFEMMIAVEPSGMLGPPLVPTPGSGEEAVDEFFRNYVRFGLRLDLRLAAGYYRATIVP